MRAGLGLNQRPHHEPGGVVGIPEIRLHCDPGGDERIANATNHRRVSRVQQPARDEVGLRLKELNWKRARLQDVPPGVSIVKVDRVRRQVLVVAVAGPRDRCRQARSL